MPAWGWPEWFVVGQTALPALMFIPGLASVRTPARVAAFAVALVTWAAVASKGRSAKGDRFPARPWLVAVVGWLALEIFHPDGNTATARVAHFALYLSILSPAFWAGPALADRRQVGRLIKILFACNALGAVVGLGQVFRPEIFNPPVIPSVIKAGSDRIGDVSYLDAGGRRIFRPCGLTDQVGAAAAAGMTAALLGMGLAMGRVPWAWRPAGLAAAFVGVAVIYYSQVRMTLVMLAAGLALLTLVFLLQRDIRRALLLGLGGVALILGGFAWVAATSGADVTRRFAALVDDDPGKVYFNSRGMYVRSALEDLLWRLPLGAGLGRWGQISDYFGDGSTEAMWVEVMIPAWVVDGGLPLLILYPLALAAAMFDSARIALRCRDPELRYWAAVILAMNFGVIATCFSYVAFLSPYGLPFWLFSASLHAADKLAGDPGPGPKARPRRVPA